MTIFTLLPSAQVVLWMDSLNLLGQRPASQKEMVFFISTIGWSKQVPLLNMQLHKKDSKMQFQCKVWMVMSNWQAQQNSLMLSAKSYGLYCKVKCYMEALLFQGYCTAQRAIQMHTEISTVFFIRCVRPTRQIFLPPSSVPQSTSGQCTNMNMTYTISHGSFVHEFQLVNVKRKSKFATKVDNCSCVC